MNRKILLIATLVVLTIISIGSISAAEIEDEIISDTGEIEICNAENFKNLYEFNFSGRGLSNPMDTESFSSLIEDIHFKRIDLSDFNEMRMIVNDYYSAEFLEPKFLNVLNNVAKASCSSRFRLGNNILLLFNFKRSFNE